MTEYLTKDGDTADEIAWSYYGTNEGLVLEQMLDANKGLAGYGPNLPAGVTVNLPDITIQATQNTIKLWD